MIANLEEDRINQLTLLSECSVSIAKYGDSTGGGSSELNQTEAASQRIEIEEKFRQIELDISELNAVINKIERALFAIGKLERGAITGYYFEKKSWEEVGIEIDCTGKTARAKANRGIKDMAFMIFGAVARPKQLSFCFFKLPHSTIDNFG
ncbi:MAG: hypothetical protein H6Q70_2775 [Firmicutes bacterium]|nr:hypothetical protein [Bacillota bacterium]